MISIDKKIYLTNIFVITIFLTIIIVLLYMNLHNQKEATIHAAKNKTESLAKFMTTDIDRIIFGVEELIEGIYLANEHLKNHQDNNNIIKQLLMKNLRPYIQNILIVNKDSNIVHWTQQSKKPDIQDREYITYHTKQKKSTKLFIGTPKISRVDKNKWFFAISKAFYKNDMLNEIVVITLNVDYFYNRYRKAIFHKNATILMAAKTGELYSRYPYPKNHVGRKVLEIIQFGDSDKQIEHIDIISSIDGKARIATLVKSEIYPFIAGISVLKEDVLASWRQYKNHTILLSLLIFMGFVILILYYGRLQKKLINLTQLDSLTKLLNRGYFEKLALKEFRRAKRFNEELTVVMIDIDYFKNINDTYGHQVGDRVIQKLSAHIQDNTRNIDLAARYGGEEFILLLVKTPDSGAQKVASRIKDIFQKELLFDELTTTASFGISSIKPEDESLDDIIKRADYALYDSKHSGRNQITVH